jgi:signal peptidase I
MPEEEPTLTPNRADQKPLKSSIYLFIAELIRSIIIVVVLAYVIRAFVLQPFIVDGSSMEPLLQNNDYLLVDKLSYHFEAPKRGDVIVFRYPEDTSVNYVKRIIGLPGETVIFKDGKVEIVNSAHPNGFILNEPYIIDHSPTLLPPGVSNSYVVPKGSYFVMGDNRPASSDSRIWGFMPMSDMIGRVVLEAYPINDIHIIHGMNYNS